MSNQTIYKHYGNILGTNDTTVTAFGQQKVSVDTSKLHMMWTYDIPKRGNKELLWNGSDYMEQTSFVNATSVKGGLHLTSSSTVGQRTQLRTLQHVRYQPNRGYIYSASIMLPDLTNRGTRKFGSFIPCNGVFIEVVGTGSGYYVNFVIKNHWKDDRVDITNLIPESVDLSKGNLWDIQMEWRGVGDYKIYLNLELIYIHQYTGRLDEVSLENPSLPASFECINSGDEVIIHSGCVDISVEGGQNDARYYGSLSTGTTMVDVSSNAGDRGSAVLCFKLPKKINYGELVNQATGLPDAGGTNEVCYSRDVILDAITTFCKDESFTVVSAARGVYVPNISALTGWTQSTDSYVEYLIGGDDSALNTAFQLDINSTRLLHSSRHEKDFASKLPSPNPSTTPFFITSDSYIIVSMKPDGNGQLAGVNIEFSEEI